MSLVRCYFIPMGYHLEMLLQQHDAGRIGSLVAEACAPVGQRVIQVSRYR